MLYMFAITLNNSDLPCLGVKSLYLGDCVKPSAHSELLQAYCMPSHNSIFDF